MTSIDLLTSIFHGYVFDATWFLLAHLVLLFFVIRGLLEMQREAAELALWKPKLTQPLPADDDDGFSASAVLGAFIRETDRMARRSLFVPMTDYSDRIDSMLTDMVGSMTDKINLFLIIGLAGTLFGVFEFAATSSHLGSATSSIDTVHRIGEILPRAMAKAFPVGFFGLLWMLILQVIAAASETSLHRAVAQSTRRALEFREHIAQTHKNGSEEMIRRLETAMAPLTDLKDTLGSSLEPVVRELTGQVQRIVDTVATRYASLEESTQLFHAAANRLQDTAEGFRHAAQGANELLKSAPKVLRQSAKLQEQQEEVLQQSASVFAASVTAAENVVRMIEAVDDRMTNLATHIVDATEEGIRNSFREVGLETEKYWRDSYTQLRMDVQNELAQYLSAVSRTWGEINGSLQRGANEMERLATNSNSIIEKPLRELVEHGKAQMIEVMDRVDDAFRVNLPKAQKEIAALEEAARIAVRKIESVGQPAVVPSRTESYDKLEAYMRESVSLLRLISNPPPRVSLASRASLALRAPIVAIGRIFRRNGAA
ncbi:MAG TPA: hypothetical protein VFN10_02120 [Thermoanaerobaculia bacterium]|nr:hypothetical protein [Thermoanaerobaculia bacterium]